MGKGFLRVFISMILFFSTSGVHAFNAFIKVGTHHTPDPETGKPVLAAMNPDGIVDISYIPQGLLIRFMDWSGKPQEFKMHFEFRLPDLSNYSESDRAFIMTVFKTSQDQAHLVAGEWLRKMFSTPKGAEIHFDGRGRIGFIHTDYSAHVVGLSAPELNVEKTDFGTLTYDAIYDLQLQVEAKRRQSEMVGSENKEQKNPIGFVWDSPSKKAKRTCRKSLS